MKAWHFHNGSTLRDGRPLPKVGETLVHDGEPILCKQGLHASVRPLDALQYAPGPWVDRVVLGGTIVRGDDKAVATERTTLWRLDATEVLRRFARRCALDVVHFWDAPDVVIRYLRTGDESLRAAAWAAWAAWAAGAAWAATRAATRAVAVEAAARAVVRDEQNRRLHRMLLEAKRGQR